MEDILKNKFFCPKCKKYLDLEKRLDYNKSRCVDCRKAELHNYYLNKKEEFKICECGLKIKFYSFNIHLKSKRHLERFSELQKIKNS